jgi:acetyltransferase EpsM
MRAAIWGAGGHAAVVADIIRLRDQYDLLGFLEDESSPTRTDFCGLPILGGRECLDSLRAHGVSTLIVAVGDCHVRLSLASVAEAKGFTLGTAIHPQSTIADDVRIGPGTVVAAGAVINSRAMVGRNVIVNTAATVDHESVVEDGAHIGPGCHLGGRTFIGRAAWLGIGSIVSDRIAIGSRSVIGAGAVVIDDLPADVVAYGIPAKIMRRIGVG